ncbi:MAG: DNA translocase FtsK 4TM domain-containing protein, partial [Alphaproteobacteria bacterium]
MARAAISTETVSRFLRRRAEEMIGAGLLVVGAAVLVALATYDRGDPSFNRAVDAPVRNMMGRAGAYAADLLWQSAGIAALLVPIVLIAWGWRLTAHRSIRQPSLRLIAFFPALLALATVAAVVPTPAGWPLQGGFGGFTGALLLQKLVAVEPMVGPFGLVAAALAVAIAGIAGAAYVVGLTRGEWRTIGQRTGHAAAVAGRGAAVAGKGAARGTATAGGWLARLWRRRRAAEVAGTPREVAAPPAARQEPVFVRRAAAPAAGPTEPSFDPPAPRAAMPEPPADPAPERTRAPAVVELAPRRPSPKKPAPKQAALDLEVEGEHRLPPLDLLTPVPPPID